MILTCYSPLLNIIFFYAVRHLQLSQVAETMYLKKYENFILFCKYNNSLKLSLVMSCIFRVYLCISWICFMLADLYNRLY